MNIQSSVLSNEEKAIFELRSLYSKYGYVQYKMSKFEEYDLYVTNKDFLISDNVITFTDTNGKLMALKPDVTLSIIKNSKDLNGYVQKLYYNENVYRVSKGTHLFKEIMQVGLECIGDIDDYCIYEVLKLAAESLKIISDDAVLDISHLGIVSAFVSEMQICEKAKQELLKCLGQKNLHEFDMVCKDSNVPLEKAERLKQLISLYGKPKEVLPKLKAIISSDEGNAAFNQLEQIVSVFDNSLIKDLIRIDFSVIGDMKYYNGIVFKGFINGIPNSILSGGQYDKLMQKMNHHSKAIGFAVYLDMLERYKKQEDKFDVDVILLYDDKTNLKALNKAVYEILYSGKRVMVQREIPDKLRYRELIEITDGEMNILENNA